MYTIRSAISKLCAAGSDIGGTCAAGSDMCVIYRQEGRCDGHDMYRIMHISYNIIYISRAYQTISASTGMEDDMYRNARPSPDDSDVRGVVCGAGV